MNLMHIIRNTNKPIYRCVVRVKESIYKRGDTIVHERTLRVRKQLSDIDLTDAGVADDLSNIINFHECTDGLYSCIPCNQRYDYETGGCDDWDIRLVPFTMEKQS